MKGEVSIIKGKIKSMWCEIKYGKAIYHILMYGDEHYICGDEIFEKLIQRLPPLELEIAKKTTRTHIMRVI